MQSSRWLVKKIQSPGRRLDALRRWCLSCRCLSCRCLGRCLRLPSLAGLRGFAQITGEFEALRFAPGQCRHRLSQGQIVEPNGRQGSQAREDFTVTRERHQGLGDGEFQDVGDGAGNAIGAIDLDLEHFRPIAPPVAVLAAQVNIG